jgi:hypothetical protein
MTNRKLTLLKQSNLGKLRQWLMEQDSYTNATYGNTSIARIRKILEDESLQHKLVSGINRTDEVSNS